MEIFISREGQQFGPYPIEQVRELLNQNVLLPDDLAYHEGLDNWVSLSDIVGITEVPTIPPLPPPTPQIDLAQTSEPSSSPVTSAQSSVAPASAGQGRMVLAFVSVLLVLVGLGSVGIWFAFFNEKQSDSGANKASLTRAPGALSPAEVETLFADDIGTWKARGFVMYAGGPLQDENFELIIEWDKQGASTICKFAPLINGERVPFVGKKKYDPQAGVFIWRSKGGEFPEGTSHERYDAKTKTYHGEGTFPDGAKETSTQRIIHQNRRYMKSQVVKDGEVVFIREAVLTRVLDNNSNKPSLLGNILAMALPTGSGDMPAEAASESMDSEEAHDHSHDHIGPVTDSLRKSLVAYYPFNGNARNEAGNNHHGQVFGAKLTADRHGKANSAYHFKLGDHVKIDGLMGKPRNLTLSAWFKLEGPQGRLGSEIISLGDIAVLRADNNSAYAQRNGTGGVFFGGEKFWVHTMAPANYTGTGWHQIVFTFNEALKKQVTYVDGKQMASKENPKSTVYEGGGTDTFIGVHGKTAKQNWRSQGIIDDLRVYDRALTTAEVEKLFRSEKPAFPLQAGNPIKITTITELRAEAQAGDPQAQFSMGLKFINGSDGLKKNPQVTEKLWLRASKQGHLIAQMNLGLLYSRGALGEKDSLKGYQWAKLSFQGGHQRAKQLVETLEKELTPEQITEADKFVKNFIPVSENSVVEEPTNPEPNTQPVQYTILGTLTDQFDLTKAKTNVEDTLEAHPGVDLMVGLFEYNPPAILKSLKTANQLGKVKVVGFDENDATLQAIKKGTMHGTVVHNPYQIGYKSIEVLHALKQGKDQIIPKDGFIKIPARAIRRDNVEQFQATLKKHLKGPDPMAVSDDWPRFSIVTTSHAGFWTIASTGTSEAGYDLRVQTEIHKPTQGVKDQNRILQELVAKGVDGIAISPLDPANQNAFLQDIAKKTILITNDIDAPESNRRAHISLDNYEAGRLCGKLVKEALPQGGEVMIFVGLLNSETAKLRRQGLIDELKNVEAPTTPEPKTEAKQLTPEEISEALSLRVGTFKVTEKASEKVLETFTGTWVKKGLSTEFRSTGENKAGAIVTYDPVQNLFIENFENGASIHHSKWDLLTKTLVRRLITPKPPAGESVTMFLRKIAPNQNDIRVEFRRNGELVRKIEAIGTRIEKPAELDPSTKPESSDDDKKPGTVLWEFETGGAIGLSSPAIGSDGTVYVGSLDKKLYAINGKAGVKLWEFQTGSVVSSSPGIGSDGTVYVGSPDNKLYAIKTDSKGLAKSPWPMRGQNAQHTGRVPKQ